MFGQAKSHRKIHYQEEFIRFCTSMLNEVERKIQKGKQRLALSGKGEIASLTPAQTQRNMEQINLLTERINGLVEEAEQAGTDGNVEQAQGLMKLCDQLKDERDALQKQNENRLGFQSAFAYVFVLTIFFPNLVIGAQRLRLLLLRRSKWKCVRFAGHF